MAEVGNGATLPQFAHLVDGGWFAENPAGFVQPSVPYRLGGGASPRPFAAAPTVGRDTERHRARLAATAPPGVDTSVDGVAPMPRPLPLAGIRVVDLTAFWAGPIIGYACAVLGAEVIHVESTKQPDGIRLNTHAPDDASRSGGSGARCSRARTPTSSTSPSSSTPNAAASCSSSSSSTATW